jgi:two-component system, chemotaxis family, chemotaxis protein CheY
MMLSKKRNSRDVSKLASLRVLLADDHPHIRSIISGILNALAISNVETTERGDRALQLLSTGNYDLFITDYEMPGMTGIEVARQLRREARAADPKPSFDIPILMITSNITRQRLNDVRDAGVDEILAKPFTIMSVADRLNAMINNRRQFIVCDSYVGPCRRRGSPSDYNGPWRRDTDLQELPDPEIAQERALLAIDARAVIKVSQDCETIGELEREVVIATALQMAQRAKRLRIDLLERAAQSLVKYIQWAASTSRVDPRIVEAHGQSLIELLDLGSHDPKLSEQVTSGLELAVKQRMTGARQV